MKRVLTILREYVFTGGFSPAELWLYIFAVMNAKDSDHSFGWQLVIVFGTIFVGKFILACIKQFIDTLLSRYDDPTHHP